jgi:Phage major capsid protein E
MAAADLHSLLLPQVVLQVASRIRKGQGRLGRWLGWQPNRYDPDTVSISGPNTVRGDTRSASFRYFDFTRVVAKGRAPGTGPGTVAPNPISDVRVQCARFHQKVPLNYEELGNLSPIVGPNSQIDPGGQDYIQRQIKALAIQFNNAVELMASGMLQDNLWFVIQGDNILPVIGQPATGFSFQLTFQVPAGNKAQLNMLGTGNLITTTWANVGALIYSMISQIKMAFALLSGYDMTDVWVNSGTWYNVITNTEIRNLAGSAATPFAEFDNVPEKGFDGMPTGEFYGVLKADPTIRWRINNQPMVTNSDIDPSYSTAPSTATLIKMVPDKMAFFCTEASPDWCKMYHGGEYVVENPGMPGALRSGYYFWREYTTQPSQVDLLGLLNCVPLLFIPKVVAPANVIFP